MVDKLRITAHVGAVEPFSTVGIRNESRRNATEAIAVEDLQITAAILRNPPTCFVPINDQVIGILKPSSLPGDCEIECDYLDGAPDELLTVNWFDGENYPVVSVFNPDHCHWFLSVLAAVAPPCGVDGCELLTIHVDAPGAIPIPTDHEAVHSGGGWTDWVIAQNQIAPGMLFTLTAYFSNGLTITPVEIDFEWYCTCCMTGGEILSINGTYGDANISYNVDVMGVTKVAYPSDWVQWEVGDWVHLIPRPPLTNCQDSSRSIYNFQCACNIADTYTIVPIKVNNFGD